MFSKYSKLHWLILTDILLGTFMATLDSSIVSIALPTISHQLKADLPIVQWVVVSYLLAITSLLPVFGRLADLCGRKNIYATGFLVFTAGSAFCGLCDNIWLLVGMRVMQAIGASMMMANNQAIIVSSFPITSSGKVLGLVSTAAALGSLAGPAFGGFLVSWAGWQAIFFINVPIGIIGYLLARTVLPADKDTKNISFDYKGSILFTLGLIGVLFTVSNGNSLGWTSFTALMPLFLGIALLAIFFRVESQSKNPLINFSIYRNRVFMLGNFSAFLNFATTFAIAIIMPFYLQNVLHYSTVVVGLMMSFLPICMAVAAPLSGYGSDKIGPMWFTTGGLLINTLGLLYLLSVTEYSTFWQIVPSLVLVGVGIGMFQAPNNSCVMSSVKRDQIGIVNGLNALIRNLGMILGTAISVLLMERLQMTNSFVEAFHILMAFAAGISLIAAMISFSRKGYLNTQTDKR